MKYNRYKGPPLNRGGARPFYVEIKNPLIDKVFHDAKLAYAYMRTDDRFKLDPSTYSPKDHWDIFKEMFPAIYEFKNRYMMSDYMNFLAFDQQDKINAYADKPHTHNSDSGANFFTTIIHSEGAGTAFYLPPEESINTLEYTYDSGWVLKLEECDLDVEPAEIAQLLTPHIMSSNHFHKAYEIIENHPDNDKRVSLNWESTMVFEDLVEALNNG